jgi:3D (Asp-Asp-Asp) domain-containing protein
MYYFAQRKLIQLPVLLAASLCLGLEALFPHVALAQASSIPDYTPQALRLPVAAERAPRLVVQVLVTAYSSTPDQTDDTPFTTANGTTVHNGVVAANWLPFGTHVKLPEHFGSQTFVVQDRMNRRFAKRLDIWMPTREEAVAWGARYITVEVL